ncbi:hypothetical protein QYZ88_009965 [Lachnospiraceae bacterium C1.1]|nr:hypothetical protein [Lachnospiraceae bacterium C1.1]
MQKKRIFKLTAFIVWIALLFSNCNAFVYAGIKNTVSEDHIESETIIEISDIKDFEELTKKSVNESYSLGKTFKLVNDLDFSGKKFIPIALMAGVFDGNGHKIKGISISSNDSINGVFRELTKKGIVKDLMIYADICGGKESEDIGGIAGENNGLLINCVFNGTILSYRNTGGIAGHNGPSGNIVSCVNRGNILSQRRTGGITGFNEGKVVHSINHGEINRDSETAHEILRDKYGYELEYKIKDIRVLMTGGIAGVNNGIIDESENYGKIGYSSLGYLTGGIAGYSRGYIGNSINNGEISGRKDTAGIAGLFEPYSMHVYEDDSFDKAGDELDELDVLLTELNSLIAEEDQKFQNNLDAIRNEADLLRAKISENKAYYRSKDDITEKELEGRLDNIRTTADDMDLDFTLEFSSYQGTTAKERVEIMANLIKALASAIRNRSFVDVPENLNKIASNASDMAKAIDQHIKEIKGAEKKLSKKTKKMIESLEELRDEFNELDDYLRKSYDSYKCDLRNTSDDINQNVENIAAEMDALNDGLKDSDSVLRKKTDEISAKNRELNDAVGDSFDEAKDLLEDIRETDDITEIFDDISDNEDETVSSGMIVKCRNNANIYGDINSGGICGSVDYWYETESETEIVSVGIPSLKYSSSKRATILESENYADIISRKNYSGGIAGRAESGAMISCGNYGNIIAEDGEYVGGIAGLSAFTIRNSYSVCSISGNAEIGGIAGKGMNIENNKAIVSILGIKEHSGAIAGSLEKGGKVSGNEFCSNRVNAVNGRTDNKEATEKRYKDIISGNDIPEAFKKLMVTFVEDGNVVKRIKIDYGESIRTVDIPSAHDTDESMAYWSVSDFNSISENMLVEARYKAYLTAVATEEDEPEFILEGKFYPGTELLVRSEDEIDEAGISGTSDYEIVSKISFTTESEYGMIPGKHKIRILDENKKDLLAFLSDNGLETADCSRDGKYLIADIGDETEFYIVRKKGFFSGLFS